MKIEYNGKQYVIKYVGNQMHITANKQDLFAGYGLGNMNQGFKLVEEVHIPAPIEEDEPNT